MSTLLNHILTFTVLENIVLPMCFNIYIISAEKIAHWYMCEKIKAMTTYWNTRCKVLLELRN